MKLIRNTRTSANVMDVRRSQRIAKMVREKEAEAVTNVSQWKNIAKGGTSGNKKRRTNIKKLKTETDKLASVAHYTRAKTSHFPGEDSEGVEVCISFDTTGSTHSCLDEVRRSVKATIRRLLKDIPIIIITKTSHSFALLSLPMVTTATRSLHILSRRLTTPMTRKKLVEWVNEVERISGFDSDECYELVLRDVQFLSWSPSCSNRSLVLIGDANPHQLHPKSRNP